MKESSSSAKLEFKVFSTKPLKENVFERQAGISGFNQERLNAATVVLVGAGGLGGEIGEGLARKGIGRIKLFDADLVEATNLNRQLFFKENLFKNKAISLAENLSYFGFGRTSIYGYPYSFEEAVALDIDLNCSAAIVGVDNNPCRVYASYYFLQRKIPVIFTAVSETGNSAYAFVQEAKADSPCFGCLNPLAAAEVNNGILKYPCPNTPAVKDILKTVAGLVIYSVDTLLMPRNREWNYRVIYLDGSIPSETSNLKKKQDCPLCSSGKENGNVLDNFGKTAD